MALSADSNVKTKAITDYEGFKVDVPVAGSTTIYKNGWVGISETGYLEMFEPFTAGATEVGNRFFGLALEGIDNSAGSAGDKTCQVLVDGAVEFALTGAAQTELGSPVFVSDDDTIHKSAFHAFGGYIVDIPSSGNVVVRFNGLAPSTPLICRVAPELSLVTLNTKIPVISASENHNGLLILWSGAYVTTVFACDATVGTAGFYSTGDTDLTNTLTTADGDAVGDIIQGDGHAIGATSSDAMVIVPADQGVYCKCTQAVADSGTATGGLCPILITIPIA